MLTGARSRTRAERARRYRRALLGLGLCLTLAAASCAADKDKDKDEGVPAARLCGSTLDADARRALDKLSRDTTFKEHKGVPFGQALPRIRHQADVMTTRTGLCRVYSPSGSEAKQLFSVEFAHLDTLTDWPYKLGSDHNYYRMGMYGASSARGAEIAFPCTEGLHKNGPPFVMGALYMDPTDAHARLSAAEKGQAGMAILKSVTRAMARKLGCPNEARVPAGAVRPLPASEYRRPPHSLKDWRWWWRNGGQPVITHRAPPVGAAPPNVAHDTPGASGRV